MTIGFMVDIELVFMGITNELKNELMMFGGPCGVPQILGKYFEIIASDHCFQKVNSEDLQIWPSQLHQYLGKTVSEDGT